MQFLCGHNSGMTKQGMAWFGSIPATSIKWSTAGDAYK